MKKALILCAGLLFFSVSAQAETWMKTYASAQAEARKKNSLIFVDLYADWCGWCRKTEQEVFPSSQFQAASKGMVLLRLNTEDKGDGTQFAQKFGVRSLPTFLILTKDGVVAGTLLGYAPPDVFAQRLTDTRKQYDEFVKLVKNEAKFKTDYKKRLDLAAAFIDRKGYADAEKRLNTLITEKGVPQDIRDQATFNLAVSQMQQKKYDSAVTLAQNLLSRVKTGQAAESATMMLAQAYYEQGKFDQSLAQLKQFKAQFPKSPTVASVDVLIPQVEKVASRGRQ